MAELAHELLTIKASTCSLAVTATSATEVDLESGPSIAESITKQTRSLSSRVRGFFGRFVKQPASTPDADPDDPSPFQKVRVRLRM